MRNECIICRMGEEGDSDYFICLDCWDKNREIFDKDIKWWYAKDAKAGKLKSREINGDALNAEHQTSFFILMSLLQKKMPGQELDELKFNMALKFNEVKI